MVFSNGPCKVVTLIFKSHFPSTLHLSYKSTIKYTATGICLALTLKVRSKLLNENMGYVNVLSTLMT